MDQLAERRFRTVPRIRANQITIRCLHLSIRCRAPQNRTSGPLYTSSKESAAASQPPVRRSYDFANENVPAIAWPLCVSPTKCATIPLGELFQFPFTKRLPSAACLDTHWPHWVDPSYEYHACGPDGFIWTYLKDVLV